MPGWRGVRTGRAHGRQGWLAALSRTCCSSGVGTDLALRRWSRLARCGHVVSVQRASLSSASAAARWVPHAAGGPFTPAAACSAPPHRPLAPGQHTKLKASKRRRRHHQRAHVSGGGGSDRSQCRQAGSRRRACVRSCGGERASTCACVRACVRGCVRVCVCVCVRAVVVCGGCVRGVHGGGGCVRGVHVHACARASERARAHSECVRLCGGAQGGAGCCVAHGVVAKASAAAHSGHRCPNLPGVCPLGRPGHVAQNRRAARGGRAASNPPRRMLGGRPIVQMLASPVCELLRGARLAGPLVAEVRMRRACCMELWAWVLEGGTV